METLSWLTNPRANRSRRRPRPSRASVPATRCRCRWTGAADTPGPTLPPHRRPRRRRTRWRPGGRSGTAGSIAAVTSVSPSRAGTPSLRRVAGLAFPALVVLAAEPLYVLVDTAVVGHLGRTPLASLALGGGVLSVTAWLGAVLAYGTTGRSARRYGAGDRAAAVEEGVQA